MSRLENQGVSLLTQYPSIQNCRIFSDDKVSALRGALTQSSIAPGIAVVVVGSLARRDASSESDIDYFVVHEGEEMPAGILEKVDEVIADVGLRPPSTTGAFAEGVSQESLTTKIGGSGESNEELTRRMLYLLESDWLFGQEKYDSVFTQIIERYIGERITQHQLARFFLNDLIRYYRTICVDFASKTSAGKKSWGDRNVKLMFSRKFLYFSGVIAAAETVQSDCGFKRSELRRILSMSPLERVAEVCGTDAHRVFSRYDQFLSWMADASKRELLKATTDDRDEHTPDFREIKNAGHHFSWELESLLHRRYAPTHPIYQALLF